MGKKFYDVLGVPESATDDDIRKAYKKMALKYHPDKNKSPEAETKFKAVSEAYETLGDKNKRCRYDKFGDNPVQFDKSNKQDSPFFFSHSPGFFQFFGGAHDPFSNMTHFNEFGNNPFHRSNSARCHSSRPKPRKQPLKQDPPVIHDLYVSLEDVLIGCTKKMKIERNVLNPDRITTRRENKILTINVKPGWKAGTKITFKEEGDQNPNSIPSDIIFIIKDKIHELFERDGSDIRYKCTISLKQALCGANLLLPSLTGESIPLSINEVIHPGMEYTISGQGLPFPKDNCRRGNMVVTFQVQFPDVVPDDIKSTLMDCLPS
ncbi:dnaJ homolog subfamily B member 4-like [Argiope bruennichi]|uniref:DnaJ subfamily B member 4 like protein n=1 Tax=Argiope bruennichi TaxID=94029 RepID=A0A8T0F4E9_ARGBR|nr:dnaJ homolog subfamily B member 4-like [Argiope bruennichi]XP_055940899.1 dnaJ homolog subfamily B member 4-like [Argiope bruennichi]XP_055940900.1 dnaJ homolog subfamily B member 4-like [Argiope bruennichi]KAF8786084.1 DnaJ subfamily B member 4 like protein [Argiope bruennichi]